MADYGTQPPGSDAGPFIMSAEGVGRLFAVDQIANRVHCRSTMNQLRVRLTLTHYTQVSVS